MLLDKKVTPQIIESRTTCLIDDPEDQLGTQTVLTKSVAVI